jgi:general secretion pathway protein E
MEHFPMPQETTQISIDPSLRRFTTDAIIKTLFLSGLISNAQAKEILGKKDSLRKRLNDKLVSSANGALPRAGGKFSVTIIDVLASLGVGRADDAFKGLDEEVIFKALAKAWGIEYLKIDPLKLDLNLVTTTIPRSFAMTHLVLPITIRDGVLTVATVNPFNQEMLDDVARATQLRVKAVMSPKSEIVKLIHEFFGFKRSIAEAESYFGAPSVDIGNLEQYVRLKSAEELPSNDQHIVNAVNHLFSYAFDQRASDIHIEPKRDVSLVRMRIDGILHSIYRLPKNVHSALVSRIKNLSRLDMAEKRRPQDGRIKTHKGDLEAEIRISTIPVAFGEKVVMRIMDPDILFQDLNLLGFTPTDLIRFNKFIKLPHGIILVTGPTGSGKSTTLYSTLRELSTPQINITTIEDPIEMVHEDFNQIAVQPAVGITFSTILRNILRQDPDIIMIGEMRDLETAQNAIQAALTGHLVLSTLHTNDAPSSLTRLLDLGIPEFLIQNTLVGVIAQRLVRKICSRCKELFKLDAAELKGMGIDINRTGIVELARGQGCPDCRNTGYHGRTAVFEVMPYTDGLRRLTTTQGDHNAIWRRSRDEGMITLRENAVNKMLTWETTYQEVLRVTGEL